MMGLHIFVRDLLTGTWVLQDPMRWADAYPGRIATAVAAFLGTGGGTLQLTGTAEAGRVRVINTAGMAVADVGWMSVTDTELAAAGITPSGGWVPPCSTRMGRRSRPPSRRRHGVTKPPHAITPGWFPVACAAGEPRVVGRVRGRPARGPARTPPDRNSTLS